MKTIQEKNEMIATFMGNDAPRETWVYSDEAEYHESWDWIMPVVDKIMQLDYAFEISQHGTYFKEINESEIISEVSGMPIIENTYEAVVEFIEWYNNNN